MSESTCDNKSLSPFAKNIKDVLLSDDKTTGQKRDALRQMKGLPLQERGDLWDALKAELSPTDYVILHGHYIRYTLGFRWLR